MESARDENKVKLHRSFVAARTQWNPCLKTVTKFLHDDTASQYTCHITSLEFSSATGLTSRRTLDLDSLTLLLRGAAKEKDELCGRILIVEDLFNHVLETLGSLLKIDPLFFTSHIDIFQIDITTTTALTVTLPSTTRS